LIQNSGAGSLKQSMVKSFHHQKPSKKAPYSNSWDAKILHSQSISTHFPPQIDPKKNVLFFSRQERQLQASKKERKTAIQQVPMGAKC